MAVVYHTVRMLGNAVRVMRRIASHRAIRHFCGTYMMTRSYMKLEQRVSVNRGEVYQLV